MRGAERDGEQGDSPEATVCTALGAAYLNAWQARRATSTRLSGGGGVEEGALVRRSYEVVETWSAGGARAVTSPRLRPGLLRISSLPV